MEAMVVTVSEGNTVRIVNRETEEVAKQWDFGTARQFASIWKNYVERTLNQQALINKGLPESILSMTTQDVMETLGNVLEQVS